MKKVQPITGTLFTLLCFIVFQAMTVQPVTAQDKPAQAQAQQKPAQAQTQGKPAQAQKQEASAKEPGRKWADYAKTENGVEYFYDKDSMLHEGEHVLQVWRRRVFPPKSAQQEIISFDEINCKSQQYRSLEIQVIYWDNSTETFKKVSGWGNIFREYPEVYFIEKYCP